MDHKEAKPKNIKEQLLLKFYDYLCIILGGGGRKGVARGQNTPYNLSSISIPQGQTSEFQLFPTTPDMTGKGWWAWLCGGCGQSPSEINKRNS